MIWRPLLPRRIMGAIVGTLMEIIIILLMGGGSTTSMSQYIAQQDRNVQYGGRGESMGLTTSQSQPSSMLYSS